MRIGEIIIAVAVGTVIFILLEYLFGLAFLAVMGSYAALLTAFIIAMLVSSLIVGYVFAGQIQESRMGSAGRIAFLVGILVMFGLLTSISANRFYGDWLDENLRNMFSTGSWTKLDWYSYGQMAIIGDLALNVALAVVLSFVGVYLGSLRKKAAKT